MDREDAALTIRNLYLFCLVDLRSIAESADGLFLFLILINPFRVGDRFRICLPRTSFLTVVLSALLPRPTRLSICLVVHIVDPNTCTHYIKKERADMFHYLGPKWQSESELNREKTCKFCGAGFW